MSPIVAIIQARFNSSRLPGKVLLDLAGHTVLARVVERVSRARGVDSIVVATTTRSDDDATAEEAARAGASVFRGSELDTLDRFAAAARQSGARTIVRICADCPLFDPDVLSEMLVRWTSSRAKPRAPGYLSNCRPRTYPIGLDAEIFTAAALFAADARATSAYDREHVTPFIVESGLVEIENYAASTNLARHRWTLDTLEDWALINGIYAALGADGRHFSTQDVLNLLQERPDLVALNAHVGQQGRD